MLFLPGPSRVEGLCRPGSQPRAHLLQVDSLQTLLDGPSLLVCAGNEAFRHLEMENDGRQRTRTLSGVAARSGRGKSIPGLPGSFKQDSDPTGLVVSTSRSMEKVLWPGS